jgi:hypothetical protein
MKHLLLLTVLFVACRGGTRARNDAQGIVRAYERFQGAAVGDRPAALASFEATPCVDPKVCADRDRCAEYARHLFRAQDLARRARELGPEDAGGNGAATPAELSIIVSGADDETKAASVSEPLCRGALDRLYALARE